MVNKYLTKKICLYSFDTSTTRSTAKETEPCKKENIKNSWFKLLQRFENEIVHHENNKTNVIISQRLLLNFSL